MALDPNIILQARPMDLGQVGDSFLKGAQVGSNIAGQKSQIETQKLQNQLTEQQISDARFKNLDAREQSRLRSVILGSAELKNYLDSNNTEGAKSFLLNRRANLQKRIAEGDNVDTTETDEALQMLDKNPKQLMQNVGQLTKFGQQLGVLSDPRANEADLNLKNAQAEYYNKKATQPEYAGATGILVERLMKENPGMSFSDALFNVQTGNRVGVTANNGKVTPIPGLEDAKSRFKRAEAIGTDTGKSQAESIIDLPKVRDNAKYLTGLVNNLITDPGLPDAVGAKNILSGAAPMLIGRKPIEGSDAANFIARLEQIKGDQFLQAYGALKGGGAISEVEGQKAEKAVSRMQTAQSEKEFIKAANEFKDIVSQGVKRAEQRAGIAPQQNPNTQNQQNQAGQVYTTPGGVEYKVKR